MPPPGAGPAKLARDSLSYPGVAFRTASSSARLEPFLLRACARVDRFMLEHSIRRRPVAPAPGLRECLTRAEAFYGDPRLREAPERFFAPPQPLRAIPRRLVPLPGGELVALDYETDFEPVFPELRGDPLEAGNRRGVALWWKHTGTGHPVMLCAHGYKGSSGSRRWPSTRSASTAPAWTS